MVNKCLDRFQTPNENVQPYSAHNPPHTIDLPQSSLQSFPTETSFSTPTVISPGVDMPPLLNQPHWHASDKPVSSESPDSEPSNQTASTAGPSSLAERTLPYRPKLTIPSKSVSGTNNFLIADDNSINRKVNSFPTMHHDLANTRTATCRIHEKIRSPIRRSRKWPRSPARLPVVARALRRDPHG